MQITLSFENRRTTNVTFIRNYHIKRKEWREANRAGSRTIRFVTPNNPTWTGGSDHKT